MILTFTSPKTETNCYLLEENEHVIIIDPSLSQPVCREIEEMSWTPDYILLTHEHFDHIEALEELRETYEIPVVACCLCSRHIQDSSMNLSSIADIVAFFKTGVIPEERRESFTCRPADITFDDDFSMEWQNLQLSFQRLPGHSPGSVIITAENGSRTIIFSGDYLIKGEEEITRLKGGSSEDYETISRPVLDKIPDGFIICPGHGEAYLKGAE